jgi:hypothetical protein
VALDGERVATIPAADLAAAPEQDLTLDPDLLSARNTLTLRALDAAGRPARGPWQALRAVRLALDVAAVALPSDLALLPLPFVDPGFDARADVTVVLPAPATPERARLAALAASWIALDAPVPVDFGVRLGSLPAGAALVLVDSPDAAARLGLPPPAGPAVRMVDHPAHPDGRVKLVVVEGRDGRELRTAVEALAARGPRLVGDAVRLAEAPLPAPAAPYAAPRWLPSGRAVPFSEYPLGGTPAHEGATPATLRVRFRVSPDLWIWPADLVVLDLGWSERLPPGAPAPRLDVDVNGYFLATLPAPGGAGESSRRVRLRVPREHLRGFNELRVHVSYPAGSAAGADPPRVAVLGDSVLHLERFGHFAPQPDVALVAFDGFPFTRLPDLAETVVALPAAPSARELSLAVSMLAQWAQVTGRAGTRVRFVAAADASGADLAGRDLLVVGGPARNALAARWAARLPVAIDAHGARVQGGPSPLELAGGPGPIVEMRRAREVLAGAAPAAVLAGMVSPASPSRAAVVVAATSDDALPPLSAFLGYAEARSATANDVLLLSGDRRWMFRIGPSSGRGDLDAWTRLRWFLAGHWLALLPVLAGGALALAAEARRFLARRMRSRLAEGVA